MGVFGNTNWNEEDAEEVISAVKHESGWSPGNLLGSAFNDLKDITLGIGSLGLNIGHDAVEGAMDVADLIPGIDVESDYNLDDIAKALPGALKEDYSSRYGSVEGFKKGLQDHPVSFLADLLTVATLGGAGAAKGAEWAGRAGTIADDLARVAATGADDVGRGARLVDAILPGMKDKIATEAAGGTFQGSLGGSRQIVDATGQRVSTALRSPNPAKRFLDEAVRERVTRMPVEKLKENASRLHELVESGQATRAQMVDAKMLDHAVRLAEMTGQNRIYAPAGVEEIKPGVRRFVSRHAIRKYTTEQIGDVSFHHVGARDTFRKGLDERLEPLVQAEHYGPETLENFHVIEQFDTPATAGRLALDDMEKVVKPDSARGEVLSRVMERDVPLVRSISDPESGIYQKIAESAKAEFIDSLKENGRTFDLFQKHVDQLTPEESVLLERATAEKVAATQAKAQRYVEGLSEGYMSEQAGVTDELSNAFDDVNLFRHDELTSQWISEIGPEGYALAFDYAYQPLQLALERKIAGRTPKAGAPFTEVVDELYEALGSPKELPSTIAIDDAMQAIGRKQPGYYPKMLPVGKQDFVMKLGGDIRGMRKRSNPNVYKKGQGVLLEDFMNGQRQAYATNPAEAYTRAASQIIRHKETERFIEQMVTTMGRRIDTFDMASAAERVVNLDAVKMLLRKRGLTVSKVDDFIEAGQELDQAFLEAVSESLSTMPEDLARSLGEHGKLYAVPKVVAEELERIPRLSFGKGGMRLAFDGPINMWRQFVLYTRPAFYVNNAFGNTAFLKLKGGSFVGMLRQLDPKYAERVKALIPDEVKPYVESGFYSKTGQRSTHYGDMAETRIGKMVTGIKESVVGRGLGKARDAAQSFNQILENSGRREAFVSGVEKQMAIAGARKSGMKIWRSAKRLEEIAEFGADPATAKAALKFVDDAMNNYAALGTVERKMVVRFVSPFFPFYKHVVKLLVKMPFEHPGKARILELLAEVQKDLDSDMGVIPEWLEGFLGVGAGAEPGTTRFLSSKGANPFAGVLETPFAQMNPYIQAGYENVTGQDSFTGRKFTSPNLYSDPFTGEQFTRDPETGEIVRAERRLGGILAPVGPDLAGSLIEAFPPLNLAQDLLQPGARYGTGETMTGDDGEALYPQDPVRTLLKYLGVSTIDYNLQNYQSKYRAAQTRAAGSLP